MSGMAGPDVPAPTTGARVTIQEIVSESYRSAAALARAFGQTVLEPSWWPADTTEIAYNLDGPPGRRSYRIGSTRAEGVPILVVADMEAAWAGRSPGDWLVGEWSEPPKLAHLRGLIGRVGDPPRLHVVIYDRRLAIQLIGYNTEDEIMSAIRSLRPVGAEPPGMS